jgi:hypothetical protein
MAQRCSKCRKKLKQCTCKKGYGKLIIFFSIVVISIVIFLWQFLESRSDQRQKEENIQMQIRKAPVIQEQIKYKAKIVKEWVSTVQKIVDVCSDNEARAVYQFMIDNIAVGIPFEEDDDIGIRTIIKPRSNLLKMVIFDEYDYQTLLKWDFLNKEDVVASYKPQSHAILIKDLKIVGDISNIWKGIILLHEGRHAREFYRKPFDHKDEYLYSQHELETHIFQHRITSLLGGEAYLQILDREKKRISYMSNNKHIVKNIVPECAYYEEQEDIFGPTLSEREKNIRQLNLWINAYFLLIEEKYSDAREQKIELIKKLYKKINLL